MSTQIDTNQLINRVVGFIWQGAWLTVGFKIASTLLAMIPGRPLG